MQSYRPDLVWCIYAKRRNRNSHRKCIKKHKFTPRSCCLSAINVCSAEKDNKRRSNTLLHLVSFSLEQMLCCCLFILSLFPLISTNIFHCVTWLKKLFFLNSDCAIVILSIMHKTHLLINENQLFSRFFCVFARDFFYKSSNRQVERLKKNFEKFCLYLAKNPNI